MILRMVIHLPSFVQIDVSFLTNIHKRGFSVSKKNVKLLNKDVFDLNEIV
jgi:hypothetical protein